MNTRTARVKSTDSKAGYPRVAEIMKQVKSSLERKGSCRIKLPHDGTLHLERNAPFLCLHRSEDRVAEDEVRFFVTSQASHLLLGKAQGRPRFTRLLLKALQEYYLEHCGGFLVLEIWSNTNYCADPKTPHPPGFIIHSKETFPFLSTVSVLQESLTGVKVSKLKAEVQLKMGPQQKPPGLEAASKGRNGPPVFGLEIAPIWLSCKEGQTFSLVRRSLSRQVTNSLKKTVYQFISQHTAISAPSYHTLGPRILAKSVWDSDERIAKVATKLEYLLCLTPVNGKNCWQEFKRKKYRTVPKFLYRPIPFDPALLKRDLFDIPIEKVEDPTIAQLFRAKQGEVDLKLTALNNRNTSKALYANLSLYGAVDQSLFKFAVKFLKAARGIRRKRSAGQVSAVEFARRARREIHSYTKLNSDFTPKVVMRDDLAALMMVSKGKLLVSKGISIPKNRVEALLNHEIGTHLVCSFNGKQQKLKQLRLGLPLYEELQEGLAVLSEYIAGELSIDRLRVLAARVVACYHMSRGADFIECFQQLHNVLEIPGEDAFIVTMRAFRGGGTTKDSLYLRGFLKLIDYLQNDGEIAPLFVGRFGFSHIPLVKELLWRQVLFPATLTPHHMLNESTQGIIDSLRGSKRNGQQILLDLLT